MKPVKPYVIVFALYATHIKLLLTTTILRLKFLTIRVFPIHFCYGYSKIIQIWLIKALKNVEMCTVCEEDADIKISTREAFLELLSSDTLIYANLGTIGDSWRKGFFAKFRNNRWFFEEEFSLLNLGTIGDSLRKVFFATLRNNRWFFEEGFLC